MSELEYCQDLNEIAMKLVELKPWEYFSKSDFINVRAPALDDDEDDYEFLVSISGDSAETFEIDFGAVSWERCLIIERVTGEYSGVIDPYSIPESKYCGFNLRFLKHTNSFFDKFNIFKKSKTLPELQPIFSRRNMRLPEKKLKKLNKVELYYITLVLNMLESLFIYIIEGGISVPKESYSESAKYLHITFSGEEDEYFIFVEKLEPIDFSDMYERNFLYVPDAELPDEMLVKIISIFATAPTRRNYSILQITEVISDKIQKVNSEKFFSVETWLEGVREDPADDSPMILFGVDAAQDYCETLVELFVKFTQIYGQPKTVEYRLIEVKNILGALCEKLGIDLVFKKDLNVLDERLKEKRH